MNYQGYAPTNRAEKKYAQFGNSNIGQKSLHVIREHIDTQLTADVI